MGCGMIENMKEIKTNAMRRLDQAHIKYETLYYDIEDEKFSATAISDELGVDYASSFKTLALKHDNDLYIIVIRAFDNIDLKKAAKALKVKDLKMLHVKDLLKEVGYERGSVAPLGIRKNHVTVLDKSVEQSSKIIISGGMKGISLKVAVDDLKKILNAKVLDVSEEKDD